jgi:hypothetical protein
MYGFDTVEERNPTSVLRAIKINWKPRTLTPKSSFRTNQISDLRLSSRSASIHSFA